MRILYIEDNPTLRCLSVMSFEALWPQDQLVVAENYRQAESAFAEAGPFDLIISDYEYPGMNDGRSGGREFYALWCASDAEARAPFVFFSGRSPEDLRNDLLKNIAVESIQPYAILTKSASVTFVDVVEGMVAELPPRPRSAFNAPVSRPSI